MSVACFSFTSEHLLLHIIIKLNMMRILIVFGHFDDTSRLMDDVNNR